MFSPILLKLHPSIYSIKALTGDFIYESMLYWEYQNIVCKPSNWSTLIKIPIRYFCSPFFIAAHLREVLLKLLLWSAVSGFKAPEPAFPLWHANGNRISTEPGCIRWTLTLKTSLFSCCFQWPLFTTSLLQPRLLNESYPMHGSHITWGYRTNKVLSDLTCAPAYVPVVASGAI